MSQFAMYTLISVTAPVEARGDRATYYAVVTRARHGRVRVVEHLDVVLTASPDAAMDGVWEVSMADELFFEVITTSAPTAAEVKDMLRQRRGVYAADIGWTPAFQSLPRVWVRRSMVGNDAGTSLVTTVRGHRLHEVQVDEYATAVSLGPLRLVSSPDRPHATWEADVRVLMRSHADGSVPDTDPTDPWSAGPWARRYGNDSGPWLPSTHVMRIHGNTVTLDGAPVGLLDLKRGVPLRHTARRHMLRAVLGVLGVPFDGPRHAEQVYDRLARVEEFFPAATATRISPLFPTQPVLVIQHESGTVHLRCPQRAYGRSASLLSGAGFDYAVDLHSGDCADGFGSVNDLRLVGSDDGLVASVARILDADPTLHVLGYAAYYDTKTRGPTVRFRRVDDRPQHPKTTPWVRIIDYDEVGGLWVFGEETSLVTVLDVAIAHDIPVLFGVNAGSDALCVESPAHGPRLQELLKGQGFIVLTDEFRGSEGE
ncbi:hypothetical protein ASG76_02280 [Nocardioides sp. Soil774]|uniref:hypothetical protein n=1 Tax=Nocardioides sp. Soil774 TaxID=1736408 RepID=UPI000701BB59|nr:hypothetical protein [Nocardioides sp. Soil774]KRE97556.1 hypothetical protein ASG76_02280 [Nocardioides sp. Soil774]